MNFRGLWSTWVCSTSDFRPGIQASRVKCPHLPSKPFFGQNYLVKLWNLESHRFHISVTRAFSKGSLTSGYQVCSFIPKYVLYYPGFRTFLEKGRGVLVTSALLTKTPCERLWILLGRAFVQWAWYQNPSWKRSSSGCRRMLWGFLSLKAKRFLMVKQLYIFNLCFGFKVLVTAPATAIKRLQYSKFDRRGSGKQKKWTVFWISANSAYSLICCSCVSGDTNR